MHAMASRDDDRTVILAQDDAWSADSPLTDYDPALRPPPLAQRLSLPPGNSSLLIDAHGPTHCWPWLRPCSANSCTSNPTLRRSGGAAT
ncbi:hypothetical protein UMZ34_23005 [Halopseudomonas pachastrellae]|nr:hypothetical protein UMZ34_23005 [Halopseudomonas pachastrellae]